MSTNIHSLIISNVNADITSRNSLLTLNLPTPLTLPEGYEVALGYANNFYSIFNITPGFNNNTCSITYNSIAYNIQLGTSSGIYLNVSDLSSYIQLFMKDNGLYLLDQYDEEWYPFKIEENGSIYGCTLTIEPVPSILPTGWTNPAGLALTGLTPVFTVPATNFGKLIGFAPGNYPSVPQATKYMVNSSFTPQIHPISSILITCSLVSNLQNTNNVSNVVLYIYKPQVDIGEPVEISPPTLFWSPCVSGVINRVSIDLRDQAGIPVDMKDPSQTYTLLFRKRPRE